MVFSSTLFLFLFLPITLAVYYFIKDRFQNYWLLAASFVFFGFSQPDYIWIIVLNIVVNYLAALAMSRWRLRRLTLLLCMAVNLGLLIYFKYFDFIIESVNLFFHMSVELRHIVLPIGISFFTFQGMSYSIDVYRGVVPVQKNPFKVALYIVLFPQLIAGPIVRYAEVVTEIDRRSVDISDMACGIQRFIIGLAKKAVVANTMAVTADTIWGWGAGNSTPAVAWVGSIAYALQIYYDFSGYSDMAIGLGRMFGFRFGENFRFPYISLSITEFWKRWHISLSSWFRDYVYISLGGNRKRVYLNLIIVFLLTGVWHGASWNFIVWGIWHGAFILIERALQRKRPAEKEETGKEGGKRPVFSSVLRWCYTLLVVNLGWVLFRAETLGDALLYMKNLLGLAYRETGYTAASYLDGWTLTVMLVGILFSTPLPKMGAAHVAERANGKAVLLVRYGMLLFLLGLSAMRVMAGTYNPFIYFQF